MQLQGLYYKDGGPIIGCQLKNERQHSVVSPGEWIIPVNRWIFTKVLATFIHAMIGDASVMDVVTTAELGRNTGTLGKNVAMWRRYYHCSIQPPAGKRSCYWQWSNSCISITLILFGRTENVVVVCSKIYTVCLDEVLGALWCGTILVLVRKWCRIQMITDADLSLRHASTMCVDDSYARQAWSNGTDIICNITEEANAAVRII